MHQRTKHCPQKSHLANPWKTWMVICIFSYSFTHTHAHTHVHTPQQNRDVNIISPFLSLSFSRSCWSSTHIEWSSNQWAARSKSTPPKPTANRSSPVLRVSLLILNCILSTTRCYFAQGMIKCRRGKDVAQASVWKMCACTCLWCLEIAAAGYRSECHCMRAIKRTETFIFGCLMSLFTLHSKLMSVVNYEYSWCVWVVGTHFKRFFFLYFNRYF